MAQESPRYGAQSRKSFEVSKEYNPICTKLLAAVRVSQPVARCTIESNNKREPFSNSSRSQTLGNAQSKVRATLHYNMRTAWPLLNEWILYEVAWVTWAMIIILKTRVTSFLSYHIQISRSREKKLFAEMLAAASLIGYRSSLWIHLCCTISLETTPVGITDYNATQIVQFIPIWYCVLLSRQPHVFSNVLKPGLALPILITDILNKHYEVWC